MMTQFETAQSEEQGAEPQAPGAGLGSRECAVLGEAVRPAAGFTLAEKKAKPITAGTSPSLSARPSGADPAQG